MAGTGGVGPGSGSAPSKPRKPRKPKKMPDRRLGDRTFKPKDDFTQVDTRNGVRVFSREGDQWKYARGKDGKLHRIRGSNPRTGKSKGPQGPSTPKGPKKTPYLDALTELQYGGQQRELESQRRISQQQSANMGGWYQDYQQKVQQAAATNAAYTAGLQQAQFNQANMAAGTDQAQNQQLLQQQQSSAAQRGATVDPSVAQNMQAGVAARQAQGTAMGGQLAAQGQAQTGYLGNRVGVAAQQGIQAQQDERGKSREIDQLFNDLEKEMGAFRVKTKLDLRDQRHKRKLENAAFGLDVREQAADEADDLADQADDRADNRRDARQDRQDARDDRIDNRREKARLRLDRDKYGLDVRKEQRQRDQDLADDGKLNNSAGGSGGSGDGPTPTATRGNRSDYETLRAIGNRNPNKGYAWHYDKMIDAGYDALMAGVAARLAAGGTVPPKLARKFKRRYGFLPKGAKTPRSPSLTPRNPDGTPG